MKRNMITSYHPAFTIQTYRLRLGILYNRTFPNFCRMPVFECCLSCICWCDGSFRWLNTWDEWVKCFLLLWLMSPTRRRQTVLICLPIWFIVSQQLHWICASPRRGKKILQRPVQVNTLEFWQLKYLSRFLNRGWWLGIWEQDISSKNMH